MVDDKVGGFVAENLVDNRLGLIEEPDGKRDAALGRIGAPNGAGHPCAEPHLDRWGDVVTVPQAQAGFEIRPEPLGMLRGKIGLSA